MSDMTARVEQWTRDARALCAQGKLTNADFDRLLEIVRAKETPPVAASASRLRQRLLYLHALTPSIGSPLSGATLHEPRKNGVAQMDPMQQDPSYNSVHEAILDGWQVIHFPQQIAPFDDKEIDVLGYEFILQKMEPCDA